MFCDSRSEGDEVPPPQLLRYSTDLLPERDRLAAFREGFVRQAFNVDWIDLSDAGPRFEVSFLGLGTVAMASLACSPSEVIRNARLAQDGTDNFCLSLISEGLHHSQHADHDQSCGAGSVLFVDHERPLQLLARHGGRSRNVTVSRAALKALVANPEQMAGQLVRPSLALRLLDGYLAALTPLEQAPSPELGDLVALHLLDLVAAAVGPTRDARDAIERRGVKAARLRAALAAIARRCCDPALDVGAIARELGVSRRNLQRLLEETGKSFTEHVAEHRLKRAYALLTDPASAHLRIIEIALASGFGDVSHFNRSFRRHFGDTPSGVRTTRRADH
jgi:AraC-like DNA-binding protein